jgi:FkbM family methyltransferase
VAHPILARAARVLRRSLGFEEILARLDRVEQRQEALQGLRYPYGPLYLGDHEALVATRWGAKMVVDTRDRLLAPWLLLDGLWEANVTGWMERVLSSGHTFVDVGANVGYFTLLGAELVGGTGRVAAVEAHPGLFGVLRRNVVMNGYWDRVELWQRAAWSEATTLQFRQRVRYAANSSLGPMPSEGLAQLGDEEEPVEVEAARLDDLLDGLGRIDVIKIDVEGAELRALLGLEATLASNRELTLMIEWSPAQLTQVGDAPEALVRLLQRHGFGLRLIERELARIDAGELLALPYGNVVACR